jgi:hypothetical protein
MVQTTRARAEELDLCRDQIVWLQPAAAPVGA